MCEPTIESNRTAVRELLQGAFGEYGCVFGEKGCVFDFEITPTPLNLKISTEDTPTSGLSPRDMLRMYPVAFKPPRVVPIDVCAGAEKTPETQPAPKKPTMVKMKCKRFMDGNTKMIEILKISGVSLYSQLPREYTMHVPYYVKCDNTNVNTIRVRAGRILSRDLREGDKITYQSYGELMRIMEEAGQRLTDINARIKKEQEFSGEFEVTI